MSAFDTYTNTPSASFTNAYGSIVMESSGSNQYVYGYRRTFDKRYLEYYINDAGGDKSKLWVGLGNDPTAAGTWNVGAIFGSTGLYSLWQKPNVVQGSPPSTLGNLSSISTGDVYMFCVDFGGGKDHAGNQIAVTTTDGRGNNLLPIVLDVGKNGSWGNTQIGYRSYAAGGISGYQIPLVVRESTTASAAVVSLRVVTTSFAYAIPSGFIAWGDGVEGGVPVSSTYSIAWDPSTIVGDISMSDSNHVAKWTVHAASLSYYHVYSTALPPLSHAAGRRVVEFWSGPAASASASIWPPQISLVDANLAPGALSATGASVYAYRFGNNSNSKIFRGTAHSSLTHTTMFGAGIGYHRHYSSQWVIDHTNQRLWAANRQVTLPDSLWGGIKNSLERASPYKGSGTDGATITDSVGLRWAAYQDSLGSTSYCQINTGQHPYITYPLMPGVVSYDGGRAVTGTGDTWITALASCSYSHGNQGIATRTSAVLHIATNGSKNTGKQFFQIFHGQTPVSVTAMVFTTGLRPAGSTTLSAAAHTKNNLVWEYVGNNPRLCRYSTTSTVTHAWVYDPGAQSYWESIAVDFDAGKIWFGIVSARTRTNEWLAGGDPGAGTGANMTFTANTAMRAFTWLSAVEPFPNKTTIFVSERNNVIDLPTGFDPWNGPVTVSITTTPSGAIPAGGGRVLWPYGVTT